MANKKLIKNNTKEGQKKICHSCFMKMMTDPDHKSLSLPCLTEDDKKDPLDHWLDPL